MSRRLYVLFPLAVLASAPLAAQRALTVERIFSAPSLSGATPTGVQWAPDGKAVTFLRDSSGGNELDLWSFDLETGRAAILVRATDLTRGAEQSFSPEELAARERRRQTAVGITAYHRSGTANKILFPFSGDLYAYDLASRAVARLTRTDASELDPKWSPDGRFVAFVRDNDLYALEIATGRETRLTRGATDKLRHGVAEFIAEEEMNRHTGYWWSPDSRRIAFIEADDREVPVFSIPDYIPPALAVTAQPYPQAGDRNTVVRVGVVALSGGSPTWMQVGTGPDVYIPRVGWLPDGRTLAVQHQNRGQDTVRLLFVDAGTGAARLVLTETDSAWVNLHDDFTVLDEGRRFLWTSERDGFRQVYLYEASGRLVRQVTRASWDVDAIAAVDETRGVVYFTGRGEGPLEAHLYAIGLDGTGVRRVTGDRGWHIVTVGPGFDHFIDVHSDRTRPPSVAVRRTSGEWVGWLAENAVPELVRSASSALARAAATSAALAAAASSSAARLAARSASTAAAASATAAASAASASAFATSAARRRRVVGFGASSTGGAASGSGSAFFFAAVFDFVLGAAFFLAGGLASAVFFLAAAFFLAAGLASLAEPLSARVRFSRSQRTRARATWSSARGDCGVRATISIERSIANRSSASMPNSDASS
jgi:dipeptidyl-peptidase-4